MFKRRPKRLLDGMLAREAGLDIELTPPPAPPPKRFEMNHRDRFVGLLVAATSGLFYLFHTGQNSFWLDSAEFVTTAHGAGVAHPPGTPLYVLLSTLAAQFPMGTVAFRLHLMNVLLGSLAVFLLYAIGLLIGRRAGGYGWSLRMGAAAVALGAALNPGLWFHAVRAEVYALNLVLCLGIVWTTLRWQEDPDSPRYLLLIALLGGLGLANHHLLTGLTGLACLGYALFFPRMRKRLFSRHLAIAVLLGLAGLLTYLYLPLRAADGWRMWGDPTTAGGFLSMVSARAFHISVTEMPRAPVLVALLVIFESWLGLIGVPLVIAATAGLIALLLRRRPEAGLLLALAVVGGLSKAIMYLDVENPDDHAYFLIGMDAFTLGAVGLTALPALLRPRPRLTAWLGASVALLAAASSALLLYADNRAWCDLSRLSGPDVLNRHFHEQVPPDALFMPSYYATFFNHLYFREVEQRRPDLLMIHQSLYSRFDGGAAYAADVVAEHPESAPLFEEFQQTGYFPMKAVVAAAADREILFENDTMQITLPADYLQPFSLGEGGLPLPADQLAFDGPGVLYNVPRRLGWNEGRIQRDFWTGFYEDLGTTGIVHGELAKLLVWYHYRNALYFVNRRAARRALLEVQLARQLKPNFKRLFEFEKALTDPAM